ncbi:MAG: MFS transporter [Spirochaetes bacterium]|nr:MFS transporter [Spirochaetota bacterium]MBU0956145.1 MFS transporter [Spirochaetota bacterium]
MKLGIPYFLAFSIYGVVSPYLAVLVRDLGYSPSVVGLLIGLFELAGIGGPFILGRFSDRLGRYRPGMTLALMLLLLSLGPLILFRNPLISALSLMVLAVGVRSIVPLLDAVATLSMRNPADYGKVRTVGSISFVLMTLFLQWTPLFQPHSYTAIALWIALSSFLMLCSLPLLPAVQRQAAIADSEPKPLVAENTTTGVSRSKASTKAYSSVFILGLVIIGLGRLAMAPVASFFSLYIVEELGWDAVGLSWAIAAASEIPLMFLSGLAIRRWGAPRLLLLALIAVAVRLAIYALFPSPAGAISGQLLHSLCYGLFHPAAVAFVSTHVAPERRAMGLTMYLSLGVGLPTFLGSAVGGFIVDHAGYRVLFASFIVFAIAGIVLYLLQRSRLETASSRTPLSA